MQIHIDTEFTSLSDPQLISIGAVAADGRTFYGIVEGFPRRACTAFVLEQVLPLLEHRPADVRLPFAGLTRAFGDWLAVLAESDTSTLQLIADDECDIEMLRQLLSRAGWSEAQIKAACVLRPLHSVAGAGRQFRQWFEQHPEARPHNALDDACAYREALRSD